MKLFLAYVLAGIGSIACIFFYNYSGEIIPLKAVWLLISVVCTIYAVYQIIKYKSEKRVRLESYTADNTRIDKLKDNGERIRITLENCEVKTRTFTNETTNTHVGDIQMLDGLYDDNRNFKSSEVQQTYIVFHRRDATGNITKFTSKAFNTSAVQLRNYIDKRNGVNLYIDKKNPNNYFFDLPH